MSPEYHHNRRQDVWRGPVRRVRGAGARGPWGSDPHPRLAGPWRARCRSPGSSPPCGMMRRSPCPPQHARTGCGRCVESGPGIPENIKYGLDRIHIYNLILLVKVCQIFNPVFSPLPSTKVNMPSPLEECCMAEGSRRGKEWEGREVHSFSYLVTIIPFQATFRYRTLAFEIALAIFKNQIWMTRYFLHFLSHYFLHLHNISMSQGSTIKIGTMSYWWTHHGECLPAASLAVCKDTCIVSLKCTINHIHSQIRKHLKQSSG